MKRNISSFARGAVSKIALTALVITALGGLPSQLNKVAAQNRETIEPKGVSPLLEQNRGVIIIKQGENGEFSCGEASGEEARSVMESARKPAVKKIILNPPAQKRSARGAAAQEQSGLTIILRGTEQLNNFPAARQGFIRAAERWQSFIKTPITVVIDVDFGPTRFGVPYPEDVLGSTFTQLEGDVQSYPNIVKLLSTARATLKNERSTICCPPTNCPQTSARQPLPPRLLRSFARSVCCQQWRIRTTNPKRFWVRRRPSALTPLLTMTSIRSMELTPVNWILMLLPRTRSVTRSVLIRLTVLTS